MTLAYDKSKKLLTDFALEVVKYVQKESFIDSLPKTEFFYPDKIECLVYGTTVYYSEKATIIPFFHEPRNINPILSSIPSWTLVDDLLSDVYFLDKIFKKEREEIIQKTPSFIWPSTTFRNFTRSVVRNISSARTVAEYYNDLLHKKENEHTCKALIHGLILGEYIEEERAYLQNANSLPKSRGIVQNSENLDFTNMVLRPVNTTDFEPTMVRPDVSFEIKKSQCVLEWNCTIPTSVDIDEIAKNTHVELEKNIRLLRLLVGGKWIPEFLIVTNDPISNLVFENNRFDFRIPLKANIRHDYHVRRDLHPLSAKDVGRIREVERWFKSNLTSDDAISTRIERATKMFEEANIRDEIESVLYSIIGLEALYSVGAEQELRLKISIRTSSMLDSVFDRGAVYQSVSEGYKVRSNFVHGEKIDSIAASRLAPLLLDYLQVSIILWNGVSCKSLTKMSKFNKLLEENPMISSKRRTLKKHLDLSQDLSYYTEREKRTLLVRKYNRQSGGSQLDE